jgi:hypothetical protein
MTAKKVEGSAQEWTEEELDVQAQNAIIKRTRTMSDREMLEYLADTMEKAAYSRPQRRNRKEGAA